jgi:hypothetical protein
VRKKEGRQASGRATLAPVTRTKGGKTFYVARGSIPVREADGRLSARRVERGFGPDCTTEAERQAQCARWNADYEERFRNPRKLITFAKAYSTYIKAGNPLPYYATKILVELGQMQCSDIDDASMLEAAEELWPDDAAPGTINRHLYTPVLAVLHMALKEKAPELARPAGHNEVQPVVIPPESWYRDLAPQLNRNQFAFVMCMAMHGRRTREMLGRRPADLDVDRGILDLWQDQDRRPPARDTSRSAQAAAGHARVAGAGVVVRCRPEQRRQLPPRPQGRLRARRAALASPALVRPAHVGDPHAARWLLGSARRRRARHDAGDGHQAVWASHQEGEHGRVAYSRRGIAKQRYRGKRGERALIDASNFGDKCLAPRRKLPVRTAPECLPSEGSTLSS